MAGSAYDGLAAEFDRQRTLPDIIARLVRNAIVTEADLGCVTEFPDRSMA